MCAQCSRSDFGTSLTRRPVSRESKENKENGGHDENGVNAVSGKIFEER